MIGIVHKESVNHNSSDSELIAVTLHKPWQNFLISGSRKRNETTFSQISNMFPKLIHPVKVDGFLMKVILFIIVFTINEKFL